MKNYSQITFEFQEPTEQDENAGVGVRIKSLKKPSKQANPDSNSNGDTLPASQSLFGDAPDVNDREDAVDIAKPVDIVEEPGNAAGADLMIADHNISSPEETLPTPDPAIADDEIILDFTAMDVNTAADRDTSTASRNDDSTTVDNTKESIPELKSPKSNRGRKSLKTIDEGAEKINIPPDEELFKKQYYAIGEVAEMFQVNQSLLRFWETEFDIIQPRKNRKGDRHFRPIDIKNLLLIHDLLRRRKLTIEGAKDFLKKNKRSPERFAMIQSLQKIKGFLLEVRATL